MTERILDLSESAGPLSVRYGLLGVQCTRAAIPRKPQHKGGKPAKKKECTRAAIPPQATATITFPARSAAVYQSGDSPQATAGRRMTPLPR